MKISNPFRRQSKTTDPVFIDLTSDFGFKAVLGNEANKDVLLELLRQLVPDENIAEIEYIDKAKKGLYSTFAVQDQMKKGLKDYNFAPVYMISFTCEGIEEFASKADVITRLNLCTRDGSIFVADNLNYIYVELNKFTKGEDELTEDNVLECLLYSIKHMFELKQIPKKFSKPLFHRLYAASRFAAMNAVEQYKYIRNMTTKMDIKAQMDYSYEQGMEKGMAQGGENERLKIVNTMKANSVSDEDISKYTGISIEELERILNKENAEVK